MGNRIDLGKKLEKILLSRLEGIVGRNVYFQPPPDFQIKYPCIIYRLATIDTDHADNAPYAWRRKYTITLIDENPDSCYIDQILRLPRCAFDRFYIAENLNHWVFTIYS